MFPMSELWCFRRWHYSVPFSTISWMMKCFKGYMWHPEENSQLRKRLG
jgi:hypothetical protein